MPSDAAPAPDPAPAPGRWRCLDTPSAVTARIVGLLRGCHTPSSPSPALPPPASSSSPLSYPGAPSPSSSPSSSPPSPSPEVAASAARACCSAKLSSRSVSPRDTSPFALTDARNRAPVASPPPASARLYLPPAPPSPSRSRLSRTALLTRSGSTRTRACFAAGAWLPWSCACPCVAGRHVGTPSLPRGLPSTSLRCSEANRRHTFATVRDRVWHNCRLHNAPSVAFQEGSKLRLRGKWPQWWRWRCAPKGMRE